MPRQGLYYFDLLLCCFLLTMSFSVVHGWSRNNNPVDRIVSDYRALTRRVTARHILLPPGDKSRVGAIVLKSKIRQACCTAATDGEDAESSYPYIVDVFARAAAKYSRDDTTNTRGGLLGELVPQGYCRDATLDRACFQVPIGEIAGPIETDYGYHLLLVEERTNCPKLDGRNTKLVPHGSISSDSPRAKHGLGQIVPSQQEGRVDVTKLLRDQVVFWIGAFLAGGVVAELSAC